MPPAVRGLTRGAAMVSEKHCNFLINTGDATAADIEGLGEEVRRRVVAATGVTLEWEIRRIGVPAGKPGRDEAVLEVRRDGGAGVGQADEQRRRPALDRQPGTQIRHRPLRIRACRGLKPIM